MRTSEIIRKIGAFQGLDDHQCTLLGAHCEECEYRRGARLFGEGDSADHLWALMEGLIDLRFELPARHTSAEHTVDAVTAEPDAARTIGWSCFVPPFQMRLSAYCASDACKILRFPKQKLTELFEDDPRMGYLFLAHMMTVVGRRFHQFQEYVAHHMGKDILSDW